MERQDGKDRDGKTGRKIETKREKKRERRNGKKSTDTDIK